MKCHLCPRKGVFSVIIICRRSAKPARAAWPTCAMKETRRLFTEMADALRWSPNNWQSTLRWVKIFDFNTINRGTDVLALWPGNNFAKVEWLGQVKNKHQSKMLPPVYLKHPQCKTSDIFTSDTNLRRSVDSFMRFWHMLFPMKSTSPTCASLHMQHAKNKLLKCCLFYIFSED